MTDTTITPPAASTENIVLRITNRSKSWEIASRKLDNAIGSTSKETVSTRSVSGGIVKIVKVNIHSFKIPETILRYNTASLGN